MAFISFGQIDQNLIAIVIGCIACFLNRLLNQYKNTILVDCKILTSIYIIIPRIFTVFLFIKAKMNSKVSKKIINLNKEKSFIKANEEIVKDKWGFIFLAALFFFIQNISLVFTFDTKTNAWICYILLASFFYYLIFKIKLYRHHYLSASLILIIGITIDLITKNLQNEITKISLLIKFIKEIFFALYNVMAKYVMEKKYVSVYELSFYIGVINFILSAIIEVFDYFFFKYDDLDKYFNNFDINELLVMLGIISSQFVLNIAYLFTIKIYSPCHVFIIFVFGQLAYYIYFEEGILISTLVIVCLIFILFLSLIFSEIIELNFCKLSYNTKKNISKRAESDEGFYSKNNEIFDDEVIDEKVEKGEYLITLNAENASNHSGNSELNNNFNKF